MTQKTILGRFVNWYIWFRFLYGRGNGHIGLIMDIVSKLFSFAVLVKLWGLPNSLILVSGVLLIIVSLVLGYFDVTKHIADKEMSFGNRFNPELQELLRRKNK